MLRTIHSHALEVLGLVLTGAGACMASIFTWSWLFLSPEISFRIRFFAPINGAIYLSLVMVLLGIIALLIYRHGERVWIEEAGG